MEGGSSYSVVLLKEGYSEWTGPTKQRAAATVTLVRGPTNVIVDTGLPSDRNLILRGLNDQGLVPDQIEYVVCTCGQSDHIGNNNLFPAATFIVSYDISRHDQYTFFPFENGQPYVIDAQLQVLPTPGHTNRDVSVLVGTADGAVAVTGDLFERREDLDNPDLWRAFSEFPDLQAKSRALILELADFIVPGHGAMFRIPAPLVGDQGQHRSGHNVREPPPAPVLLGVTRSNPEQASPAERERPIPGLLREPLMEVLINQLKRLIAFVSKLASYSNRP
jgi:glyoxylase-like metal-dependent hydrolase (beta-lactamase superfamily II)